MQELPRAKCAKLHCAERVRFAPGVVDDLLDDGGEVFVELARCDRVAGDAGVHYDVGTLAFEEHLAGRHFVQDGPEAVDVGAVVATAAVDLLGGHVVGRAHGGVKPTKVRRRASRRGRCRNRRAAGCRRCRP